MRYKLFVGGAVAVLLIALGGAALALGPWGEAAEKPPCAEWNKRIFDAESGKIRLPEVDDEGNSVGFSMRAARGLLDEKACAWVFRPKGEKKAVHWDKRYSLAVAYDLLVEKWATSELAIHTFEDVIRGFNKDGFGGGYYAECGESGGTLTNNPFATGHFACNFDNNKFDYGEGDYLVPAILGPEAQNWLRWFHEEYGENGDDSEPES